MSGWPWPSFSYKEISCRHCGKALVNPEAMDKLQSLRDMMGRSLTITSAYRCPTHNKAVGGSDKSYHKKGVAFDIKLTPGVAIEQLRDCAGKAGFTGFGFYPTFLHTDTGPSRTWHGK